MRTNIMTVFIHVYILYLIVLDVIVMAKKIVVHFFQYLDPHLSID